MGEECEDKNSFDFPFSHENGGHGPGHGENNATQDILRENEEESSGASDYPEGISGFTPPKDFRIHKLVKAKTDRKTTKKPMHRSHSASKLSKREPRPSKSKSMIELPLPSPDGNVSRLKQRHFSIPPATTSGFKDTMENTLLNKEKPFIQHESQSFPAVSEPKETESINVPSQTPAQSCIKSSTPSMKKDLSNSTFHVQPHSTSNPWQRFPFRRRSSVDANTLSLNSIVSRTSSSTNSSLRLFDSLHDLRIKPRTSLNLLSLHVDQDDRLDYGIPNRMKSSSLSQHRHTSSFIPECPRERSEFYSHLHMTVLHLGIAGAVARRHADAEETYLTKESIHQSISMQLRAYLQNRSVKVVSDDLALRKLDVDQVINDIMDFVLPLECEMTHKGLFRPFSVRSLYTEISSDSNDGYGDDNKPLETISEEDSESQSTDDLLKKDKGEVAFHDDEFMTSAQARAMQRVKEVLGALDEAEGLYQSLAEMGDEHPKYRCLQFIRRVEALHLWMRITEMLASKLCQMSRLCGIRVDLEPGEDDVCLQSLNSSRISWNVMEMEQTRTSCCEKKYRDFVDQHLKKYGLEKMMKFIKKSLDNALLIARYAYTGERNVEFQLSHRANFHRGSSSEGERIPLLKDSPIKIRSMWERSNSLFPTFDEGWLSVFEQMNLPSFDRQFLQLARVPLDVMHICIRKNLILRFQDHHLSILSLKALVKECRQIIMEAIEVRNDYREAAMLVTGDDQMKQEQVTTEMETFEDDLQNLLKEYFNYVQRCNLLGEPGKQWNILQLEWDRVKSFCVNIKGGEAQAGRVFCAMVERQVQSVGDFFQNKVDNFVHQMHSCRLGEQIKQCLQRSCRNFKELFVDMRERIVKTLGFAKLLRKDLEIAADFDVISNHNEILHNLLASDHVQVVLQHGCDGRLLFVPESIADNMSEVVKLLSLNFGRNETTADTVERSRRYLVILEVDGIATLSSWPKDKIKHVDTSVETAIAVTDLQVNGLKLIVQNFSDLQHNCDSFQKAMGGSVSIRNRQTSGHESVNESIAALTNSVITLSKDVLHSCEEAQDHLTHENEYVEDQNLYRDAVHSCFNLGFECCQEMIRLIGSEGTYKELGNAMVVFAKRWAKFVLDSCERGRGTRPRWATPGLDFLTIACHPLLLMELTNVEYEELAEVIKKCLDHVVGDSSTSTSRQVSRLSSRRASDQWSRGYFRRRSSPSNLPIFPESGQGKESPPVSHSSVESNSSGVGNDSPPVSTAVNLYPMFNSTTPVASRSFSHQESNQSGSSDSSTLLSSYISIPSMSGSLEFDTTSKYKEIQASLEKLDAERDEKLRSNKIIGHVVEQTNHQGINRSVSVRHVNFRWQRGKKIGAGKFGTVYSCINMDTSELMAVKQIPFQESNHSDIERIYDEVRFVQNINHPNIVRVYGMERHHDELFLFMEFCGEGTIWDVAKQGLTIDMIRKYTYEVTVGLDELHRQSIVHRDIKGANIFITADGSVKIGDFGLCVQIKHAKTRPEEIKGTAGTAAYMAPEVIHGGVEGRTIGRSADIWSLGCVVVEMATGKMPYCDLDNEYAIMFQVGNGIPPTVPNINDALKAEGKDFLSRCFHSEPDQRWTASKLLEHSFVKWIHR